LRGSARACKSAAVHLTATLLSNLQDILAGCRPLQFAFVVPPLLFTASSRSDIELVDAFQALSTSSLVIPPAGTASFSLPDRRTAQWLPRVEASLDTRKLSPATRLFNHVY